MTAQHQFGRCPAQKQNKFRLGKLHMAKQPWQQHCRFFIGLGCDCQVGAMAKIG
jgi:hypothetical protein